VPPSSIARRAARTRSTDSAKSNSGRSASPLPSSIDRPAMPVAAAAATFRRDGGRLDRESGAEVGADRNADAAGDLSQVFQHRGEGHLVIGAPRDQAKPELVVASALNPSSSSQRALPGSQGFGITKQPDSCRR